MIERYLIAGGIGFILGVLAMWREATRNKCICADCRIAEGRMGYFYSTPQIAEALKQDNWNVVNEKINKLVRKNNTPPCQPNPAAHDHGNSYRGLCCLEAEREAAHGAAKRKAQEHGACDGPAHRGPC